MSDKFTIIIPPQDIACNPDCLPRLADGDREAFEWVYRNYSKKIYDYALLMTCNEAMSEDVVQDVFLKLWYHHDKLKYVKDFNGYMYMLYRNHIMDVFKRGQKEISVRNGYYNNTVTAVIKPDEQLVYKERFRLLDQAMKNLPPQQKIVFNLRLLQGLKREQIAEQLNISPSTVKNHLQKSLKFLKQYILERMI